MSTIYYSRVSARFPATTEYLHTYYSVLITRYLLSFSREEKRQKRDRKGERNGQRENLGTYCPHPGKDATAPSLPLQPFLLLCCFQGGSLFGIGRSPVSPGLKGLESSLAVTNIASPFVGPLLTVVSCWLSPFVYCLLLLQKYTRSLPSFLGPASNLKKGSAPSSGGSLSFPNPFSMPIPHIYLLPATLLSLLVRPALLLSPAFFSAALHPALSVIVPAAPVSASASASVSARCFRSRCETGKADNRFDRAPL